MTPAQRLDALCVSGLLRCIRKSASRGLPLSPTSPLPGIELDLLRFHWGLSAAVASTARAVVDRPRGLAATWAEEEVERYGDITGAVDAAASVLAQQRTLNPTLFVLREPTTTGLSGLNHLVQWTLFEALHALLSARRRIEGERGSGRTAPAWLEEKIVLLESALRNGILRDILLSPMGRRRPGTAALRAAAKTRLPLYRVALRAFRSLQDVEAGDEAAVRGLLEETLSPQLEDWERLELVAALAAAQALARAQGCPVELSFPLMRGKDQPLARAGRFAVHWQYPVPPRDAARLDGSELMARDIQTGLGVTAGTGRADVAVCEDGAGGAVVRALLECKLYNDAAAAVRQASGQLVGYARDLHPADAGAARELLRRSVLVVEDRGSLAERADGTGPLHLTDVGGLERQALLGWAKRLVEPQPGPGAGDEGADVTAGLA